MKKKVLLIENDVSNIDLTKRIVRDICDLDAAVDYTTAIELANNEDYSAILLDINFGIGPDGLETLKAIKKIKNYEEIPVIAITAYAMKTDRDIILKAGVLHYLVKPVNVDQLRKLLADVLQ